MLSRLVERVQYITGATGAAIGLLEGTDMVCRATSGTTAPDLGVHLETWKGLSGECIRTGETLRCENVEFDKRVDVESCQRMGVQSIVVTPVRRNNVVVGIFELFSSQPYAFQDRDVATLQRTTELVKKELERRPLVVDAAYVRLPDQASQDRSDDQANGNHAAPIGTAVSEFESPAEAVTSANEGSYAATQVASVPCRNCGAAIEAGRLLCPECGSLQADPEALPITADEDVPAVVPQVKADRDPFRIRQRIRIPKYSVGVVLAMIALFVAFVPIHTNQVDAQSPAAAQAQEQPAAPAAASTPGSQEPAPTVQSAPAQAGAQSTNASVNSIPSTAPAAPAPSVPVQSSPGEQPVAYAAGPPSPSAQPPEQPPIVPVPGTQATAQAPASSTASSQIPVTVPTAVAGPVTATPHAGPAAQPDNPLTQPRYDTPQRTTRNHQNEPWFIARVNNAIDSFQQMFQPPPDPGPTPEQLGDPRVVVWVDLTTGLYYCPGASTYGKTDKGKFLTQKEAQAEYFTSAIRIGCK